jgi:hypothetical protein
MGRAGGIIGGVKAVGHVGQVNKKVSGFIFVTGPDTFLRHIHKSASPRQNCWIGEACINRPRVAQERNDIQQAASQIKQSCRTSGDLRAAYGNAG